MSATIPPRAPIQSPCRHLIDYGDRYGCQLFGQCKPIAKGTDLAKCDDFVAAYESKASLEGPCEHLREAILGRTVECNQCGGKKKRVQVHQCAVKGPCAPTLSSHPEVVGCQRCPDRNRATIAFSTDTLPIQGAFNPSIVRFRDKLLCAWRVGKAGSNIYIAELVRGRGWQLMTKDPVQIALRHPLCSAGREDPRLFVWQDRLHMQFSGVELRNGVVFVHVLHSRLTGDFRCEEIWEPSYAQRMPWEKNWVPFSAPTGELLSVYHPHVNGEHVVIEHAGHDAKLLHAVKWPGWKWGEIRGGAPPVRVGDEFWHFFHSWRANFYAIGLYTFSAFPPYAPLRIIRLPLVRAKKFVVFPCGAVQDSDKWMVSWGDEDKSAVIGQFVHADLERLLMPVAP